MSDMYIVNNTSQNMPSTVPAFLTKLWTLVENPMVDDLICWGENGTSFHVYDQGRFAKDILPHYFKHSNIASFIRQLNMYGFRKVSHIEHGIKDETDDLEFQHMYFIRGQQHLLDKIKRKIAGTTAQVKTEPMQEVPQQDLTNVITEVQVMREKQETVNTKLSSMKRENELLWREVASLRQKHVKQQQIVNKLIQFLIHLVGGRSGIGLNLNRKRPLMLSDSNQASPPSKMKKYAKNDLPVYSVQSPESAQNADGGPVISELPDQDVFLNRNPVNQTATSNSNLSDNKPIFTDEPTYTAEQLPNRQDLSTNDWKLPSDLLNVAGHMLDLQDLKDLPTDLNTPSPSINPPFSGDPATDTNYLSGLLPTTSPENSINQSLQQKVKPAFGRQQSIHDLNDHVDTLQYDLDGLRDVLSSNQYSIDPSFLLGVINIMDPDNIKPEDHEHDESGLNTSGSELVQYKPDVLPDLFDLASLTKDDEDVISNSLGDVGDIPQMQRTFTQQHVPADDLD
ncbi:heat shock factor protein-like isoform X2 [Mytilus edulis]|uniref:heat shock factor protein-like isoform X2 n=1 Tax=Mytilus edulis TaxID=6550 RepID=UPI0039EE6113